MTDLGNFSRVQLAPSLLSADFMNLKRDINLIEQGQPEWLHVDVMDGHLVPNLTIGPPVVRALKQLTSIPLDVHLMIDNPLQQLNWYIEAGADILTVHLECAGNPEVAATSIGTSVCISEVSNPELINQLITCIKQAGRKAGLAITPGTSAELLLPFIDAIDLVMVMSVHPGFGGQSFIESSLDKLAMLAEANRAHGLDLLIEADGGININTAPPAVAAGANMLVAGNAIFGETDPLAALAAIRAAAC